MFCLLIILPSMLSVNSVELKACNSCFVSKYILLFVLFEKLEC